jgi:hypothetical protein
VTWAALNLDRAPINPLTDYMMNGVPGWERDSREFSKAAFLEGLADLWALIWEFRQKTNPVITTKTRIYRLEAARVTNAAGTEIFRCSTVSRAWEFPFCHTAALWDLIDSDVSGDSVDLTVANIVDILNRFPDGCITNGCRDEVGLDALNHLDFLRNAPSSMAPGIRSTWTGNGIMGGN